MQLGVVRVSAADYPAFRLFLGQIDQALGRKIKLAHKPEPTAER